MNDDNNNTRLTNKVVPSQDKLKWNTPELNELDFYKTEAGAGGVPEGNVGGIPVGPS